MSKTPKAAAKTPKQAKAAPSATNTPAKATAPASVPEMTVSKPAMRKSELVDLIVTRSGLKKKDVKPVLEATLAVMGEVLADGREMNLPPFAKLKVQKQKMVNGSQVTIAKLRRNSE